jgi:hypothetical protein
MNSGGTLDMVLVMADGDGSATNVLFNDNFTSFASVFGTGISSLINNFPTVAPFAYGVTCFITVLRIGS